MIWTEIVSSVVIVAVIGWLGCTALDAFMDLDI